MSSHDSPPPGDQNDPVSQRLSLRISRLHHKLTAQAASILGDSGLGVDRWRVLYLLCEAGLTTSRDMVRDTDLHPAQVSRQLKSMQADGLVTLARDDADKRVLVVAPTSRGNALYEQAASRMRARQRVLRDSINAEQMQIFLALIDKLEATAQRRDL